MYIYMYHCNMFLLCLGHVISACARSQGPAFVASGAAEFRAAHFGQLLGDFVVSLLWALYIYNHIVN